MLISCISPFCFNVHLNDGFFEDAISKVEKMKTTKTFKYSSKRRRLTCILDNIHYHGRDTEHEHELVSR